MPGAEATVDPAVAAWLALPDAPSALYDADVAAQIVAGLEGTPALSLIHI